MSYPIENSMIMQTTRRQSWQRAKGELAALLETYWGDSEDYEKMCSAIDGFVKDVEDNGYGVG